MSDSSDDRHGSCAARRTPARRGRGCGAAALTVGLFALAVLVSAPAQAISGTAVDDDGAALEAVRVCYLSADVELICVETDAAGYYELPDSRLDRIRLSLAGYLPRVLAAVDHEEPIVLEASASLLVYLRDAGSGEALGDGEIFVYTPSGRRLGPFPTNVSGVRVRTLRSGTVRISATAEGYAAKKEQTAQLVGGEETEVVIDLRSESSPD